MKAGQVKVYLLNFFGQVERQAQLRFWWSFRMGHLLLAMLKRLL